MPIPIRKDPAAGNSAPAAGSIISRTAQPATRLAPPIAAVSRYEVRIISRPAANEANIQLTEAVPTTNPATPGLPHDALHIGRQENAYPHIGLAGAETAEIGERHDAAPP